MGDNYRLQGERQKALDCLQEAMRIKLKCPELGPNHPGTVTTFSNLGKLYVVVDPFGGWPLPGFVVGLGLLAVGWIVAM